MSYSKNSPKGIREELSRQMARAIFHYDNPKNEKADVWVCGFDSTKRSKKTKCKECNILCYYDGSKNMSECIAKKHIKICVKCAMKMKKYKKSLNPIEKEILEGGRKQNDTKFPKFPKN